MLQTGVSVAIETTIINRADKLPGVWNERGVEHDLDALRELVVGGDFAFQQVVRVPLLQECEAVLGHDVFRFETAQRAA